VKAFAPVSQAFAPVPGFRVRVRLSRPCHRLSPPCHRLSPPCQAFAPVTQAFAPVSQAFAPVSQAFAPVSQAFAPVSQAFAPVSWPDLVRPPTTFCVDPSKVVGNRASEHASEGSPTHDTRGKACLCDVHPIPLHQALNVSCNSYYRLRLGPLLAMAGNASNDHFPSGRADSDEHLGKMKTAGLSRRVSAILARHRHRQRPIRLIKFLDQGFHLLDSAEGPLIRHTAPESRHEIDAVSRECNFPGFFRLPKNQEPAS
jgi:hypothetical protein